MIPAARYSWLAGRLGTSDVSVVALLGEDAYETAFGDGCFYHLRNVFLSREDAQRDADANGGGWRHFHLRPATLALRGEDIVLPGYTRYAPDAFGPEDIVRLFVARYGLGRVPAKERRWYVARDAKWLVSFGDFDNVYCYSDPAVTELLALDARAATISRVAAMQGDKPGPCVSRREWLGGERLVLK